MTTTTLRRWTIVTLVLLAVLLALDPAQAGSTCLADRTETLEWFCL